jgi:uncharacterized protein YdeI (YjbR/CyaY-like superfamily)
MDPTSTLYCETREIWRSWLQENFEIKREIWLVFPNKAANKKSVSYNDAVEEALCFGWIDSIAKSLDKYHRVQRFSPRKSNSTYSQPNKERLKWLAKNKLIHPKLTNDLEKVWREPFIFPADILDAIRKDSDAWTHYQNFSDSYKRIRVAYIESARNRPEEFEKRLMNFINKTRQNKIITGHGGVDKYYTLR